MAPKKKKNVNSAPMKVPFVLASSMGRELLGCLENRSKFGVTLRALGELERFVLRTPPRSEKFRLKAVYSEPPILTSRLLTDLPVGAVVSFEIHPATKQVVRVKPTGYRVLDISAEELFTRRLIDVEKGVQRVFETTTHDIMEKTIRNQQNMEAGVRVMLRCLERQIFVGPYRVSAVSDGAVHLSLLRQDLRVYSTATCNPVSQRYEAASVKCTLVDFDRTVGMTLAEAASTSSSEPRERGEVGPSRGPASSSALEPGLEPKVTYREADTNSICWTSESFVADRLLPALSNWVTQEVETDAQRLHENILRSRVTILPSLPWVRGYKDALGKGALLHLVFTSPLWLNFTDAWEGGLAEAWALANDKDVIVLVCIDQIDRAPSDWFEPLWRCNDHVGVLPSGIVWPPNLRVVCTLAKDEYAFPFAPALSDGWSNQAQELILAPSPSAISYQPPIPREQWRLWGRPDDPGVESRADRTLLAVEGPWLRHCEEQKYKGESFLEASSVLSKRAATEIYGMFQVKLLAEAVPTARREDALAILETEVRTLGFEPNALYRELRAWRPDADAFGLQGAACLRTSLSD